MGVIDHDGDRIMSGAFDKSLANLDAPRVAILWAHDPAHVVGKAISGVEVKLSEPEGASALYVEMMMNLKTQRGRDAYEDVKFGAVNQWSVGFNVPDGAIEYVTEPDGVKVANIKELELVEISSVLRGSSPLTGTISVKSDREKGAIAPHATATTDQEWDGPATVAAMPNDDEAIYKKLYAWFSNAAGVNLSAKSSYKFPHHEYSDGVGAANLRACSTGIAVLNGGMGGADIPDADRRGVWRHLADHIEDGDREAPDLKSELPGYPDKFTTIAEAEARAEALGCSGYHEMEGESGRVYYMPCSSHDLYESIQHGTPSGNIYSRNDDAIGAALKEAHAQRSAVTTRLVRAVAARIARVRIKWLQN